MYTRNKAAGDEERELDRIIRPQSEYAVAENRTWVPLGER